VRIDLRLGSTADWINVFDPRDGTVFISGTDLPRQGQDLGIDVTCGTDGPRVILRGQVIGHRMTSPQGFIVALSRGEHEKINYLNGFVRGGLLNLRSVPRLPVRLPVTYVSSHGSSESYTRDITAQGLFILSSSPLPEESEVQVILSIPGRLQPLLIAGVVSHTVLPDDEDLPGMGILFHGSEAERAMVAAIVDNLAQAFLAGSLPEDVLA
jgi:hypothetical protein